MSPIQASSPFSAFLFQVKKVKLLYANKKKKKRFEQYIVKKKKNKYSDKYSMWFRHKINIQNNTSVPIYIYIRILFYHAPVNSALKRYIVQSPYMLIIRHKNNSELFYTQY